MESEDNKATKTWIKIYPSYIDKELKHSAGRKVSLPYAVDKPLAQEIYVVCTNLLKLPCKLEYVHIN
jgi:signal recognition particle subunit SEC65